MTKEDIIEKFYFLTTVDSIKHCKDRNSKKCKEILKKIDKLGNSNVYKPSVWDAFKYEWYNWEKIKKQKQKQKH